MDEEKKQIIDAVLGDTKLGFSTSFIAFVNNNQQFVGVNDTFFMRLFIDQFGDNPDPSLVHSLMVDYFNFSNEFKRLWEQKFISVDEQAVSARDWIVFLESSDNPSHMADKVKKQLKSSASDQRPIVTIQVDSDMTYESLRKSIGNCKSVVVVDDCLQEQLLTDIATDTKDRVLIFPEEYTGLAFLAKKVGDKALLLPFGPSTGGKHYKTLSDAVVFVSNKIVAGRLGISDRIPSFSKDIFVRLRRAEKRIPEKERDMIAGFANSPSAEIIQTFLSQLKNLFKSMSFADVESIGTDHVSVKGKEYLALLVKYEKIFGLDKVDRQEGLLLSRPGDSRDKQFAIWSGFSAMDVAIKDPETVCNFNVPICNIMFQLWESLFMDHQALKRSVIAGRDDKFAFIRQMIEYDISHNGLAEKDVSRKYFGSTVNAEDYEIAFKMGCATSRAFVSTFCKPGSTVTYYFSNNKYDDDVDKAVMQINNIGWDHELALLREQGCNIVFKHVSKDKQVTEVPLRAIKFARGTSQQHDKARLSFRSPYSSGMPGRPEWMLWSDAEKRPLTEMSLIFKFYDALRSNLLKKKQSKDADTSKPPNEGI